MSDIQNPETLRAMLDHEGYGDFPLNTAEGLRAALKQKLSDDVKRDTVDHLTGAEIDAMFSTAES